MGIYDSIFLILPMDTLYLIQGLQSIKDMSAIFCTRLLLILVSQSININKLYCIYVCLSFFIVCIKTNRAILFLIWHMALLGNFL